MSDLAIQLRGVGRDAPVGANGDGPCTLIDAIDLDVPASGLLHILGPSGSGKSTLLRLINRLDERDRGEITIEGQPIDDWPIRQLRRHVAMVPQEPTLLGRSVRGNLALPFELAGTTPDDLAARIEQVIELVELESAMLDRMEHELSVGQKQRVALARTLIAEPAILLLDEPTASVDPRTAEALLDRLLRVRDQRELTMVCVTHHVEHVQRMGGRLAVLMDGRLATQGDVEQVLANPPSAVVGTFLNGADDAGDR